MASLSNLLNSPVDEEQSAPQFPTQRMRKRKPDPESSTKQYQSLLMNSRSRHLKKNDSEPYWRNEIQFDFLMRLLFNHHRVFKNPYFNVGFDWPEYFKIVKTPMGESVLNDGMYLTFFELYMVTMLKSSKISKILKARLMFDINYALNFTIVCLLVNIGRLNTTVNFDHEMKSQFRTYHSVPSLQITNHSTIINQFYTIDDKLKHFEDEEEKKKKKYMAPTFLPSSDPSSGYATAIKQLQDTPRIKSILKSVNDLNEIPKSYFDFVKLLHDSRDAQQPLNLISVIFQLCTHEYEIGRSFYPASSQPKSSLTDDPQFNSTGSLFNDIWMRPNLNSTEKVNKFLWLLFTFIETNLEVGKILQNPFNKRDYIDLVATRVSPTTQLYESMTAEAPEKTEIINIISMLLPQLTFNDEKALVDPLLNDFDTEQEVEYAAYMKTLRHTFIEDVNSEKPQEDQMQQQVEQQQSPQPKQSKQSKQSRQAKSKSKTQQNQPIAPFHSNNDVNYENSDTKSDSAASLFDANAPNFDNNAQFSLDGQSNILEELEKLAPRTLESGLKRKSIFDTVEARALGPSILSTFDDSNTQFDLDGQKKKKRTKKQINAALSSELPLYLSIQSIETLLNSQIKSANMNSKSSILKRNKNKTIASFIFDVLKSKYDQVGDKRRILGNWNYLIEQEYDLSFFLETDVKLNDNIGEFKVTILKALTRLNCTLNGKLLMDEKLGGKIQLGLKSGLTDFIDDAFEKLN